MTEFKKCKSCGVFNFVRDNNKKIKIVVGNYIASKKEFDNFEQAEKYVKTKPWELIINIVEITLNYEKEKSNSKETANDAEVNK